MKMLEEENAQLTLTVADLRNQVGVVGHFSPTTSPDSNNATRKLQDEINTLTKRNGGKKSNFLNILFVQTNLILFVNLFYY